MRPGTDTLPIGVVFAQQNVMAYLAFISSRAEGTRWSYVRAFKALVRHLQDGGHISSSTTAAFVRFAKAAKTATAAAIQWLRAMIAQLDPQQAGAGEVWSVQATAAYYEALDERPQYVQYGAPSKSGTRTYRITVPVQATADDTAARVQHSEYRMGRGRVVSGWKHCVSGWKRCLAGVIALEAGSRRSMQDSLRVPHALMIM